MSITLPEAPWEKPDYAPEKKAESAPVTPDAGTAAPAAPKKVKLPHPDNDIPRYAEMTEIHRAPPPVDKGLLAVPMSGAVDDAIAAGPSGDVFADEEPVGRLLTPEEIQQLDDEMRTEIDQERDPWADRKTHMTCTTCMWFAPKGGDKIGRCRKRAPTMDGFPAVYPADWCGEHKVNEDTI